MPLKIWKQYRKYESYKANPNVFIIARYICPSKHLKGWFGPPVRDVMFFQSWRSVGAPFSSRDAFIFMEVSWAPCSWCKDQRSSRLVFTVPGQFSWFFMVLSWFSIVPGGFLWFFMAPYWFFMFPGQFSWFFMVPGWFFMVPGRFSWFFMVFGWFFMVPGRFSCFFHGSRSVWMVPGRFSWFLVGFHGFSWFPVGFHGFSWFQVGFHGFSWFQVDFMVLCFIFVSIFFIQVPDWRE